MPQQRQPGADVTAHGGPVADHICGDTTPIVEDFVRRPAPGSRLPETDHVTDKQKAKDLPGVARERGQPSHLATLPAPATLRQQRLRHDSPR